VWETRSVFQRVWEGAADGFPHPVTATAGVGGRAVTISLLIGRLYALVMAKGVAGARWVAMMRGRSHRTDAIASSKCPSRRTRARGVVPSMTVSLITAASPRSPPYAACRFA
jgi:hypothetical protein